jgi:predicted nucleic acid-binding protein
LRVILPITESIADECGRLLAASRKANAEAELGDALIAATARVHGLTVATLNRKHFVNLGVELVEF